MQHPDDRISAVQDAVLRVQNRIAKAIPDSKEKGVTSKILVSSNQIGCLLGKGGSIIAEMRKFTGAYIRIMGKDQTPKSASENEVVQVFISSILFLCLYECCCLNSFLKIFGLIYLSFGKSILYKV